MNNREENYRRMWEDLGKQKSEVYLGYKFCPTHRVGLTNYLREEQIYKYIEPQPTDIVADIGCASGRQIFRLANRIKKGVGTDIAQSFIDAALAYKEKEGINNTEFQVEEIEQLSFDNETFDKVICAEVLEHVHDKDAALRELIRITKSDGKLIISTPNLNADGTWWGRLLRLVGKRSFISLEHFSKEELARHGDAHVREFTGKSMKEWLESHGLKVEKLSYVSYWDGPLGDFLVKIPLHIPGLRQLVVAIEKAISLTGCSWARHVVVRASKENA